MFLLLGRLNLQVAYLNYIFKRDVSFGIFFLKLKLRKDLRKKITKEKTRSKYQQASLSIVGEDQRVKKKKLMYVLQIISKSLPNTYQGLST